MPDYPLDSLGRYALLTRHQQKCWLCYEPVALPDMQADHIIPVGLREKPELLNKALNDFGLPNEFDLDSLNNLLPSHGRCNNQKRRHIFRATPLIHYWLDQAAAEAQKIRDMRDRLKTDGELEKAIAIIETRKGELTPEQIECLAMPYASANSSPVIVREAGSNINDGIMKYSTANSLFRYVPPKEFLVTSDTGVIFEQEPRESRDALFRYHIEHKSSSDT